MSERTLKHFRASMWWNPFTVEHLTLRSPLTPAECTQRIQARTYRSPFGPLPWQEPDPARPFLGIVGDYYFMLVSCTPRVTNSFRPILNGSILPGTGGGTRIRLTLSEFPLAQLLGCIVYPFYVYGTWYSTKEQEFLVQRVARILEAADYPEI